MLNSSTFWNDFWNAEIELTDIRNQLKLLLKEHLIDKLKLKPELRMNTITSIQLQYPAYTVPFHSSHRCPRVTDHPTLRLFRKKDYL